ncbi:MAG TPA: alpha/beta fold hydrolase [Gaiellaceae bacterium]|nr:alpha/beta fold hydrolase [Gaiellaceae bacterium]
MPFDLETFLADLSVLAAAGPAAETLPYGPGPEQVVDLVLPAGEGPHPVALLVHGGFWRARFDRSTTAALAVDLARRGVAAANVEYRRVGNGGGIPQTLEDVEAAAGAVARFGAALDPARVVAVGHSAGGHLALWLAGTGRVRAAVSLAGVCDLAGAASEGLGDGAAVELARGLPAERPEAYRLADPLGRLPTGVPQLLVHGEADDRVPVEQSRRYARAAAAAGDRCELLELPGVGHFELIDPRDASWRRVAERLPGLL